MEWEEDRDAGSKEEKISAVIARLEEIIEGFEGP